MLTWEKFCIVLDCNSVISRSGSGAGHISSRMRCLSSARPRLIPWRYWRHLCSGQADSCATYLIQHPWLIGIQWGFILPILVVEYIWLSTEMRRGSQPLAASIC